MKLFLKIIKIGLIAFLLVLSSLAIIGWAFQERITSYALDELGKTFGSAIATDATSFSLIKDFPLASIRFEGLWLGAYQEANEGKTQSIDTLVKVNDLFVSVDVGDLINNVFTIRKVELREGYAKYHINENGASNFDFLMSTDTTTTESSGEPLDLTAEGIVLHRIKLKYQDDLQQMKATALISDLSGMVKLKDPKAFAQLAGAVQLSNLDIQNTELRRMQQADLSIDLTFKSDTLDMNQVGLMADGITLNTTGRLIIKDQIQTDLTVAIDVPNVAALTKYIDDQYLSPYGISQLSGGITLNSSVVGTVAEEQLPHYEVTAKWSDGSLKWEDYPLIYNTNLEVTATNGSANNDRTTQIHLRRLAADITGSHLELTGKFSNLTKIRYNLSSKLTVDLEESQRLVPDSLYQEMKGKLYAEFASSGTVPDSIDSQVVEDMLTNSQAQITLEDISLKTADSPKLEKLNGSLKYNDHQINLQDLYFRLPDYKIRFVNNRLTASINGDWLKPETTGIDISNFRLATSEGFVDGSAQIKGLNHVSYQMKSQLNVNLSKFKSFAPDTLLNDLAGTIEASFASHGKMHLDKMDEEIETILYDQTDFDLALKGINLDMTDTLLSIKNLYGKISKSGHQVKVTNFGGTYQDIDFSVITATIDNAFNTALRNKPGTLVVDSDIKFGDLDYKVLGAFVETNGGETPPESVSEPLAWNYQIKGNLSAWSFKYDDVMIRDFATSYDLQDVSNQVTGNLTVSNITYDNTLVSGLSSKYLVNTETSEVKGKLAIKDVYYEDAILNSVSALYNIQDSVYTIDQLKFNAFDGKLNASAKVTLHENEEIEIEMRNDIDHINMRRLMEEMKDFHQDELTHKNFSGELTSDNLFLRMVLLGDSILYDDLRMTGDLKFENGGIFQYPPVQDMAQYLPKIDNLDTMSFKTINSHMFLFKDAVYVPRTYVVSSVFDVEAIGMQSFGEDYQYHVGVNLFQILGKDKGSNLDEDEPTKRKKMIRLKATGHDGNYKSGFDKVKDRDAMLIKVKTQEKILEFRFQPKFFNFDTGAEDL